MSRREIALSIAAALWGLAVAIALVPIFSGPAPAGQMPSYPTSIELDANAPIRFVAALILLPIIFTVVLRPAIARLAAGERWAGNVFGWSCIVALWLALVGSKPVWVVAPCAAVLIATLTLRNRNLGFTRRDVILLPVYGAAFLALTDALPQMSVDRVVAIAAMIVLAIRIAVAFVPGALEPAFSFLLAPAALALQTNFFARDQRYFGWHVLAIIAVTPFVVRPLLKNRRRAMIALAFVIYPIAVYSYKNAVGLTTAEGKPRANFFEDAHHLVPASEMLRGERLYRDTVPVHGLIEDGVFSYAVIRLRGDAIGDVLRGRGMVNALGSVAIYALAGAMTGSAEVGVLALFFGISTGLTNATMRHLPSLITLGLLAQAARRRKTRWFGYAGAGAVVAALASLDVGFFTIVALVVAIARYRSNRLDALRRAAIGAAAMAVPLFVVLATYGVVGDFLRSTLFELPRSAEANRLDVFTRPAGFKAFANVPEIVVALFDRTSLPHIAWVAALLIVTLAVGRRPRRRLEPIVIIAVWIVVSALAYAQRHHLFFELALPAFVAAIGWLLVRRRSPYAAAYVFIVVAATQPTAHLAITSMLRHTRGPIEAQWIEITNLRRARGAYFTTNDAAVIAASKEYVETKLRPDETFFDFSDRGLLYFLFDRDDPIRYPVVTFYQTETLQREVIARLEANPRVRAALMPAGPGQDNVPFQVRAPLVWQYLQLHFTPDFEAGDVVFWRRVESRP